MKVHKIRDSIAIWPVLFIGLYFTTGGRVLCLQWLRWRIDLCRWPVTQQQRVKP